MTKTWVVVADSNRARIFSAASPLAPLQEEHEIAKTEIVPESNRPVRGLSRTKARGHAFQPRVDPREQSLSVFAKRLAGHLNKARSMRRFAGLVLVAAPAVLGLIRNNLDAETAKLLSKEISKDLVRLEAHDLRKQIS